MLACRLAVLPRRPGDPLAARPQQVLGGTLALLTLASFGVLLSRTLELNGGAWATLWPDMRLALAVTHFGHVWWWRIPALAMLWLGWGWQTRHHDARWNGWAMLLAVAAIALTRSETGHPADHGDFTLAVWVDWLHILAAGTWVGSLFGMSLVVFPRLLRTGNAAVKPALGIFQRLSTLSGAALAVLVACGLYNAVTQLDGFAGLWTTRYGAILDIKLALVLGMTAIGAHNRYVKLPHLRTAASRAAAAGDSQPRIIRSCARAVLAESLLGIAVIGATATLLHAMPPADAPVNHAVATASDRAEWQIAALGAVR
ncbi:MAG TPA: CopD family protein [Rhodanobacteraceae bacterium]|nr:CopD family protein [Rhodanobacteraceae bacterium]